jgi:muconate cycloisomerase
MKILRITAIEVVVPAQPGAIESEGMNRPLHKIPTGAKAAWSMQFDQLPKLLLKLELANGVIGLGELYRAHDWNQVAGIAESLIGTDIRTLCLQKLPFAWCREYDGFECAVWDAFARLHNLRVVDLLGGPVRDRVRVGAWTSHRRSGDVHELAAKYQAMGFDCLKFKCDLEDDVAGWAREVAAGAPGMEIILDPNERWERPAEVRKRCDALAEVGNVLCLEDPIPRWMLAEFAALRRYSSVPIALHVSLPYIILGNKISDAVEAVAQRAVDGFNFNCGLANFQRLDHVADTAGLPCWHGSEIDLGILEAMYVHSSAAARSCIWPGDIFGRLIRSHDLLTTPLRIEPPFACLPEGIGLGVELDDAAVKAHETQRKEFC